jgi:hypothetical protein
MSNYQGDQEDYSSDVDLDNVKKEYEVAAEQFVWVRLKQVLMESEMDCFLDRCEFKDFFAFLKAHSSFYNKL